MPTVLPLDIKRIQEKLQQAIMRKQWGKAESLVAEYSRSIRMIEQEPLSSVSPADLQQHEADNRRMMRQLLAAMDRTKEDIDDLTHTINRLERGKEMLSST